MELSLLIGGRIQNHWRQSTLTQLSLNSAAVVAKVVGYFSHVWVKFVRFLRWTTQHLPFLLGSSPGTPPCRGEPCQSVAWWRVWRSGCLPLLKLENYKRNKQFTSTKTRKDDLVSLFPCIESFQKHFPNMFCLESSSTKNGQMLPPLRRDSRFCNSWKVGTGSLSISYQRFSYLVHNIYTCNIIVAHIVAVASFAWCFFPIDVFSSLRNDEAMAHRAGTGDQPIPGLVTSRVELKFKPSIPRWHREKSRVLKFFLNGTYMFGNICEVYSTSPKMNMEPWKGTRGKEEIPCGH